MTTKPTTTKTRVKVNWKLFGLLCVIASFVCVAAAGLFAFQKNRLAPEYLQRADDFSENGELQRATEQLFRYTKLYPEDGNGWYKLAKGYRKMAATQDQKLRATNIVRDALRVVSNEDQKLELTETIAELYLETGREAEAKQAVERLSDGNTLGAKIRALASYRGARASENNSPERRVALGELQKANALLPFDIELAKATANAIVDGFVTKPMEQRLELANQVIDGLFENGANVQESEAYLARYQFQNRRGSSSEQDIQKALEFADPASVSATINVCLAARDSKDEDTRGLLAQTLRKVIDAEPTTAVAYHLLGKLQQEDGNEDAAINLWHDGIAQCAKSRTIDIRQEIGLAYLQRGELDEAEQQLSLAKQVFGIYRQELRSASTNPREIDRVGDVIELLYCQTLIANGKSEDSRPLLEGLMRIVPIGGSGRDAELRASVLTTLAGIELDSNPRRASELLSEASRASKNVDTTLSATAQRLQDAGDFEASENVAKAAFESNPSLARSISLANIQLAKESVRPFGSREWAAFDETFRVAQSMRGAEDAWQLEILAAARAAHGEASVDARQQALSVLDKAADKWKDDAGFWFSVSLMFQQLGRSDRAIQAVDQYASLEDVEWKVERLRYQVALLRGDSETALAAIETSLETVPDEGRWQATNAKAQLLRTLGRDEEYQKTLLELHESAPSNLEVIQSLGMFEVSNDSSTKFDHWVDTLRSKDRPGGTAWRWLQVQRHLFAGTDRDLQAAQKLIDEIAEQTPTWPRLSVLRGRLLARNGKDAEALVQFDKAMRLGTRDLVLIEEALASAFEAGDLEKIETYLDLARNSKAVGMLSTSLNNSDTWRSRSLGLQSRLLENNDEKSPATRVFLAQLALANGRRDDAENLLLSANASEPTAQTQLALFGFYAGHDNEKAKAALEATESLLGELTEAERQIFVGERLQTIGLISDAASRFTNAVSAAPDDVAGHMQLARLYYSRDSVKAASALREVIRINSSDPGPRHLLANLLARRGGFDEWSEVKSLLEGSDEIDSRLRVVLLIQRGGEQSIAEARQILEAMLAPIPSDRLLLAVVLEADGDIDLARQQYEQLPQDEDNSFVNHRMFAEFCLRSGDLGKARELAETLSAINSDGKPSERLASFDLRLRAFANTPEQADIVKQLEGYAAAQLEVASSKVGWCANVAAVYENTQLYPNSATWWKSAVDLDRRALVGYGKVLARLNRHGEAVDAIFAEASDPSTPAVLFQAMEILSINSAQATEHWERMDELITQCENNNPASLAPRFLKALAATLKGNDQQAMVLFSELLALQPDDVVILNNLAMLQGQSAEGREQSLALIERAIKLAGPRPLLLDTKGMILTELGMEEAAIRELKHVAAIANPDPRVLFRLAVAYMRGDQKEEAKKLFLRANALGLQTTVLTAFDNELLNELKETVL